MVNKKTSIENGDLGEHQAFESGLSCEEPTGNQELELLKNRLCELEVKAIQEQENEEEVIVDKVYKKMMKELNRELERPDSNPESKLDWLKQKYLTLIFEWQKSNETLLRYKRNEELHLKQQSFVKLQLFKCVTGQKKTEALCHELKNEHQRIKEEKENKHDDLTLSKSENMIVSIETDHEKLKEKFQGFLEQYELREKHYHSVLKSKDLEIKLLGSKLASHHRQQAQTLSTSSSASASASITTSSSVTLLKEKLEDALSTEKALKEQLAHYVEKFKQVEETLSKSNELFTMFRREMENMTNRVTKLEREKTKVENQCEALTRSMLQANDEKIKQARLVQELQEKREKLATLCRSLQQQRNDAYQQLQEHALASSLEKKDKEINQ